mmetsp:Transcript_7649/g.23884  ORF Transcript_7649/g.23884 Transcript_7649/m.23884 type:complete len:155 (+) Transcript_7649:102-566(+)
MKHSSHVGFVHASATRPIAMKNHVPFFDLTSSNSASYVCRVFRAYKAVRARASEPSVQSSNTHSPTGEDASTPNSGRMPPATLAPHQISSLIFSWHGHTRGFHQTRAKARPWKEISCYLYGIGDVKFDAGLLGRPIQTSKCICCRQLEQQICLT